MPCVLRESSYNYCSNPSVLTREGTEKLMENLYGAWWVGTCSYAPRPMAVGANRGSSALPSPLGGDAATTGEARNDASSLHVHNLRRLGVDGALLKSGLVPELATEDLVLLQHGGRTIAVASLIEIRSWEASARRAKQPRLPFLFDLAAPENGTALRASNFAFNFWEKNWMPFDHDGRLLAVRWFHPHQIVEIDERRGVATQLHATPHAFASGAELHGGTPPLRFDEKHYLTVVRLRTGSWVRNRETRNYINVLYLFEAKPPFAIVRVSRPFTLPSCVQPRLHMLIQVVKSLVEVDENGYLLCWGELDCYSCCAALPRTLVVQLLRLPAPA